MQTEGAAGTAKTGHLTQKQPCTVTDLLLQLSELLDYEGIIYSLKAYIYTEKGKIELKDIPAPTLDGDNTDADAYAAILKPRYISPCSSDVHTVYAGDGPRRANLVLGHEGLAEVVEVGSKVTDFKPGDLVAVSAVMPEPGDLTGHRGAPFSGSKLGRNINGMWSELFKIPEADLNLAHIPDDVSIEAALMAVDMMATGYTAASEAMIEPGQTICVIGSGAVGLMAASAAKRMSGQEGQVIIIGSDKDPVHARLAYGFDVDTYISYRDGSIVFNNKAERMSAYPKRDRRANSVDSRATDAVFDCTGGYGADAVLICGGGAEALAEASDIVRYGTGIVVNVAYVEGSGMIGLPIFSLGRGMSGKTFKFELSRGGRDWLEAMLDEAARCDSMQGELITTKLKGFDAIPEALRLMHDRPAGTVKIMVEI